MATDRRPESTAREGAPPVRRHVAHVLAPDPYGGAESVVRALAAGRRDAGGRVTVFVLSHTPDNAYADQLRREGIDAPVIRIRGRRYFAEARALAAALGAAGVDLVNTHKAHADLVGYLAGRRLGLPVVSTLHGMTLEGRWRRLLFYRLVRRCDAVIAVSAPLAEDARASGVPAARVAHVPNGIGPRPAIGRSEARDRLGLGTGGPVVAWIGRMSREKAPHLFVEAVRAAPVPGLEAVMIGDGTEYARLVRLVDTVAHPRITLAGALPDPAGLFPAFDALVITSETEGLPIVALEAMAARVPVVAFGVGGLPDLLADGAGWVVPPRDLPALAAGIGEAVGNPEEAARRSAVAARVVRDRYGIDRWLDGVEAVYDRAAADPQVHSKSR